MVDKCGKVHHFLGNEPKKMGQLWWTLYSRLPLEQTHERVSQLGALDSYPFPQFYKKVFGVGRRSCLQTKKADRQIVSFLDSVLL